MTMKMIMAKKYLKTPKLSSNGHISSKKAKQWISLTFQRNRKTLS